MQYTKFNDCPKEIKQLILQLLDHKPDVLSASLVCRDFNKLLESKKITYRKEKLEKLQFVEFFIPKKVREEMKKTEREKNWYNKKRIRF